jgi:hypothetical protein
MDGLLALIIALVVFALFIFLISRSVKTIIFIGLVLIALMALKAFGVLG